MRVPDYRCVECSIYRPPRSITSSFPFLVKNITKTTYYQTIVPFTLSTISHHYMNLVHYQDFIPTALQTDNMDAPMVSVPHNPPTPGTGVAASASDQPVIHASPLTSLTSNDHEFTTLVRMIEDFTHKRHPYRKPFAPFVPRFDLEEHEETYELYGDFPGVKKEDIKVSVVDNGRIEVRGVIRHRVSEEEYKREQADHTHDVQVGGIQNVKEKIAQAAEAVVGQPRNNTGSHIADTHNVYERPELETAHADAAKHANDPRHPSHANLADAKRGYKIKEIIKERQEGEFHRIFHFPQPVDLGRGVQARMDNGVLHVTIPRGAKPQARQVDIGWIPYFGL